MYFFTFSILALRLLLLCTEFWGKILFWCFDNNVLETAMLKQDLMNWTGERRKGDMPSSEIFTAKCHPNHNSQLNSTNQGFHPVLTGICCVLRLKSESDGSVMSPDLASSWSQEEWSFLLSIILTHKITHELLVNLLWRTWGSRGPAGSCRRPPLSCSSPGRCESGSPCLWWLQGSSWSCFENRAAPSAPFVRWRSGQGCWRGYSLTSRDAPASSGLWTFACEDSWCTRYVPFSGPLSWRGPTSRAQ